MERKNRSVAVTGATGLVGSYVVAELIRRGYRRISLPVRNVVRIDRLYRVLEREGVGLAGVELTVAEVSFDDSAALAGAFKGAETVYHCAAAVSLGALDGPMLIEGNVAIVSNVVDAALDSGVAKLVHVSSIAALGSAPAGVKYIDETMLPESAEGLSAYYTGKYLSERVVENAAGRGFKSIIVNPAAILGTGDDYKSGSTVMIPLMAGGIPFYTEGVTAFVDVRDVARAMVELSESGDKVVGERFLLIGANMTYHRFLDLCAEASGRRKPWIRVGRLALGAGWRAASLWGMITGKVYLLTKDVTDVMQTKTYYSTDKIKKTINFEFTPIEHTIDRVVKEYLAQKNG